MAKTRTRSMGTPESRRPLRPLFSVRARTCEARWVWTCAGVGGAVQMPMASSSKVLRGWLLKLRSPPRLASQSSAYAIAAVSYDPMWWPLRRATHSLFPFLPPTRLTPVYPLALVVERCNRAPPSSCDLVSSCGWSSDSSGWSDPLAHPPPILHLILLLNPPSVPASRRQVAVSRRSPQGAHL